MALNPRAAVADYEDFPTSDGRTSRERSSKVHRAQTNRKVTAKRNRQSIRLACGGVLRRALSAGDVNDYRADELCRSCWRDLSQIGGAA
jgi:hypothetical protein